MTTDLVIDTAEIRLFQSTMLIEWLSSRYPRREELSAALEAIAQVSAVIAGLGAATGPPQQGGVGGGRR